MRVTLAVEKGSANRSEYVFSEREVCLVGRSADCLVHIPDDQPKGRTVSRHHCLFDINPPQIRIRDFGSLNGTCVNDDEIGRRDKGQTPEEGAAMTYRELTLTHGDRVTIGPVTLMVRVDTPPTLSAISPTRLACSKCGALITDDRTHGAGDMVCADCQQDLGACVADLLRKADEGADELAAIRGYTLVKELGRGGQGIVYLAEHEQTGELTALKVLLSKVVASTDAQTRFLREISSLAALRHPHIVTLRESGESGGQFFFTSDYCDSGSVYDLIIKRQRPLPPSEAVALILQVLAGLHYAHTAPVLTTGGSDVRGFVHRDIKPANILLHGKGTGSLTAKLADFGLAKAFDLAGLSGLTFTGSASGTLEFMSRIQLLDFKYARPDVDVWSTAATLYWMLTGLPPRDFRPGTEPVLTVLQEAPVPIRERNPDIPRPLAEVIDVALTDDPRIPVHSAAQFASMLQDAMR